MSDFSEENVTAASKVLLASVTRSFRDWSELQKKRLLVLPLASPVCFVSFASTGCLTEITSLPSVCLSDCFSPFNVLGCFNRWHATFPLYVPWVGLKIHNSCVHAGLQHHVQIYNTWDRGQWKACTDLLSM